MGDYPSACNAMETLLLHKETLENGVAAKSLMSLRVAGVKCLGGPKAMLAGLCDTPAQEMKCEYGDHTCLIEIVEEMSEAVECADDDPNGEIFLRHVDAACVFKNASTR